MKVVVLKCLPGSQFHFGKYAPDHDTALNDTSEIIHSDTLFAALVRTYNDISPERTNEFVKQFEEGNIRISSVFFCMEQNNKFIWFLPKPISFNLVKPADNSKLDFKKLKKVNYISKKLLDSILSPAEFPGKFLNNEAIIVNNQFALCNDEIVVRDVEYSWDYIKLYNEHTHPKVHVHKPNQEDSIYQLSTIEIADNSEYADDLNVHYYFIYDTTKEFEPFQNNLNYIIEMLAENGIGAERSTIGKLECVKTVENWQGNPNAGEYFMSLSLLSPKPEDIEQLEYYQTIFRGGRRIGNSDGQAQKSVRLIKEGAILKSNILGNVHDVAPKNEKGIYKRNGVSLNLSIPELWKQV